MQRVTWPREVSWWGAVLNELVLGRTSPADSGTGASSIELPRALVDRVGPELRMHLEQRLAQGARFELWPADMATRAGSSSRLPGGLDSPRLAWWPVGACDEPLVGLASSRLPRALDTFPELFRYVRAAVADVAAQGERLVVVESTAASGLIARAAEVWCVPVLRISVASDRMRLADWLHAHPLSPIPQVRPWQRFLYLSPPLDGYDLPSPLADLPAADRVLCTLVDRLDVLHLRRGGVWHELLRQVASGDRAAGPTIRLASHPALVHPRLLDDIVPRDAQPWRVDAKPVDAIELASANSTLASSVRAADVGEFDQALATTNQAVHDFESTADYLIHFTRRCDGPWPGQSWDEYWDELLEERAQRDRSALAVLRRILNEARILASSEGIRGQSRVVCFTAVTLDQLAERRVWRRHRRRWDFEPFGLAIRREALLSRGVRPVLYGDEAQWETLPVADRPFFQKSDLGHLQEVSTGEPGGKRTDRGATMDWRGEREWRILGDVSLANLATRDALVFVPDERAARSIRSASRFPVGILKDL